MQQGAPNPYLRTKILTASPQELRLMLYDGAIKFCRQAVDALKQSQFESSYNGRMRAQKIVLELSASLDHTVDPDLCGKLAALYTYIYRLLVDANMSRTPDKIEEAITLLEYEKQTWQMLMKRIGEKGEAPPDAGAQQTAISSLSTNA